MTVDEIYAIPISGSGWRILPNGDWVTLGDGVTLGNWVTLGNRVKLGNGVTLGDRVTLGDWVKLGDGVKLGDWVTLGNRVTLGDRVTLSQSPIAVQGSRHLATHVGPSLIQVGCMAHTFDEWVRHFSTIGKAQGYTDAQIDEYKRILDFIIASTPDGIPK